MYFLYVPHYTVIRVVHTQFCKRYYLELLHVYNTVYGDKNIPKFFIGNFKIFIITVYVLNVYLFTCKYVHFHIPKQ